MTYLDVFLCCLILATIVWAKCGLLFMWLRTKYFGKRKLFAAPAGTPCGGAIYAFTKGMMPWAKESVREHLLSYALGIAYHAGIFTALVVLVMYTVGSYWPAIRNIPAIFIYIIIPLLLIAGAIGGISLFIKRLLDATLRGISCPDDYISNFMATTFTALALASLIMQRLWVSRLWFVSAIILFAYIPFSKIRHCLFFFITRYNFGAFFGYRGCMPPNRDNGCKLF
ncbi:MAG: hypothetical protein LBH03_04255 [Holophagales bacterium]|jgi:nitrate reductase gamma subunit|nr:hypothetical protein [Holophagales bacterium]